MGRILVVEDEPEVRRLLLAMVKWCGHDVCAAGPCLKPEVPHECNLSCCDTQCAPDLAVIAVIAPRHCSGVEAAMKAVAKWPSVKVLLISASPVSAWPASEQVRLLSLPTNCYSFLPKPFTVVDLKGAVQHLIG